MEWYVLDDDDELVYYSADRPYYLCVVLFVDQVTKILTDEGLNSCSATSVDAVIKMLSPEEEVDSSGIEISGPVIAGAVAIVGAALFSLLSFMPPSQPPSRPAAVEQVAPAKKAPKTSKTNFSLLNEYMNDNK
mgnify:CR=1 FL=1